jgi:hypothetical protein
MFFTLVCNSVSHCKRKYQFMMFATMVICDKTSKETGHWTKLHNGKVHKGTDTFVGALCVNSKIIVIVTRIIFITLLLIKFLSHYMFQLELSHIQSLSFHRKHTTFYYIHFLQCKIFKTSKILHFKSVEFQMILPYVSSLCFYSIIAVGFFFHFLCSLS